ncbi:MAG: ATP-binding cassette domain-containing protein [Bacteroidaceae bacterium]|nr:ATP-binding cassette domain-containing protein [Bacteroidaceae bacterium]
MSDQVLAALVNLLALLATATHIERAKALQTIQNFLALLGIQNKEAYVELFDVVCDTYELKGLDVDKQLPTLCESLKKQMSPEIQNMLVLRVMEFIKITVNTNDEHRSLVSIIAKEFDIQESLYQDFTHFIRAEKSENVAITQLARGAGTLKLLRVKQFNAVIASYSGTHNIRMNDIHIPHDFFFVWAKNGVLKTDSQDSYTYSFAAKLLGETSDEQSIHLQGKNLEFRFKGSQNGLHNFSFDISSGELVAVMGGSGVGKSTLLSILNGSLPPDSGELTINGKSLYDNLDEMKPLMGFVPQDDLLIPELTVRENLYYTALFCFAGDTKEAINQRVEKVLADLGLAYIADLKVGTPLQKTISGGQRKRLNIALELIREPAVLFLDEPTSGLSSADSERVIHMLKEQTYRSRLVIVNIHQPSSDIYKLFDRLWLLDKGGYPIYDGNNIEAVSHFKQKANLVDAEQSVCPACGNITPDIILAIIEQQQLDAQGRPTGKRIRQAEDWHNIYLQDRASSQADVPDESQTATAGDISCITSKPNVLNQFRIYLRRAVRTFLADRQAVLITFLEAPLLATIVAFLTHYSGENGYVLMDNKNLMSYMFMAIIVATFMGMSGSAEAIFRDRAILRRERFLQLSYPAYICAKITHAALTVAVQTLLFILVGNYILRIVDLFFVWWAVMFTSALLAALTGLFLSQRMKSIVSIYITIPMLLIPQILLCGLVVPFTDIVQDSKTNNVPLIGDLIPSRWAFEALAVTTYTDNEYMCEYFNNQAAQFEMQLVREGQLRLMLKGLEKEKANYYTHDGERANNLAMLRGESQRIAERWDVPPLAQADQLREDAFTPETYTAMKEWIDQTDMTLYKRSLIFTRAIDKDKNDYIRAHGEGSLARLQRAHTNSQLERVLANLGATQMMHQQEDVLVPDVGAIYLTPTSRCGRAPFYAHKKIVGDKEFTTLQFNLLVLWLMIIIACAVLFRGVKD